MVGVYTIVEVRDYSWSSARTLGFGAVATLLLAAFFLRQARAANPLLPLDLFRSRNVSGANVIQVLMVAGMFGTFFLGALYLQRVLGYDPLQIGLAFLPVAVAVGALSYRFSAELNTRFGARRMLLAGLALMTAGLALFARAPVDTRYLADVLPSMVLFGIGGGLSFPALRLGRPALGSHRGPGHRWRGDQSQRSLQRQPAEQPARQRQQRRHADDDDSSQHPTDHLGRQHRRERRGAEAPNNTAFSRGLLVSASSIRQLDTSPFATRSPGFPKTGAVLPGSDRLLLALIAGLILAALGFFFGIRRSGHSS
jgi:hypothetical protein